MRRFARAIVSIREGTNTAAREAADAVRSAVDAGHVDQAVTALRAYPQYAALVASDDSRMEDELARILSQSRDNDLARRAGLVIPRELLRHDGLSPREREVYEHLVQGRSNREIADALFISASTTKVHVKHIFEKLGVHSRTEVALRANRESDR
jgi:DNA-binding NarL/FixJ family response regulator